MNKAFSLWLWENSPSVNTPLGQSMLNKLNVALNEIDNRVITHDTTKANQADLLTALADVTFDENTGVITFTKKNGSETKIDTKLEKLAVNFIYDSENQQLVITLDDGTIQYVDMKALITELEFLNSDTVLFSVADGKVSANIAKGSITADMLEPNYLANVELYASQALSSADDAAKSAQEAEASAIRAEEAAEKAESIAGGDFATNAKVDNIINGTTPAGDSLKMNGLTAEEFVSNDSLLDNGYFKNPVNSSGKTVWTGTGTTIDKWVKSNANATVELTDAGLVCTFTGTSYFQLMQEIFNWESLLGKTITISAKVNGTVYSKTLTMPNTAENNIDTSELALPRGYIDLYKQTNQPRLQLRYIMSATVGDIITFEYIKLELGSVATPFIPPNKEVEKLKCGVADADTVDGFHAYEFQPYAPSSGNPFPDIKATLDWIIDSTSPLNSHMKWVAKNTSNDTPYKTAVDNADTVDGYHAKEFRGHATGFEYLTKYSGDANDWKTEGHYFVFNVSNIPSGYGWLDVDYYSGAEFSPSDAEPITRQTFRYYNNAKTLVRYYMQYTNTWTAWENPLDSYLPLDGSVPMSGKFRVSAPAESPLVVETTMNSANVFAMFKNNGVEQGCFGFTGPDKPVIVNSAHSSTKEIHHDGNSAKVIVSETPLTAKGSVRVW